MVAVSWQLLFAYSYHVAIRLSGVLALGLSVWLIYASDRMLDALHNDGLETIPRHRFCRLHWRKTLASAFLATAVLIVLCLELNSLVFWNGLLLAIPIGAYFSVVHFCSRRTGRLFPKELAVGILFALGTCLVPWTRMHGDRTPLIGAAALFAALCWLNCCAIEHWEWKRYSTIRSTPPRLTRWIGRNMAWCAAALAGIALLSGVLGEPSPVVFSSLTSALALAWLEIASHRLSADRLRVLADVALLTPLVLLLIP